MYILLIYHLELDWFSQLFLIDLSIYRFHLCSSSIFSINLIDIFNKFYWIEYFSLFLVFRRRCYGNDSDISPNLFKYDISSSTVYIYVLKYRILNICSKNICLRHYNLYIYFFLYLSAVINRRFFGRISISF